MHFTVGDYERSLQEEDCGYQLSNLEYIQAREAMCQFVLEKGRDLKMSLRTLHNCILIMDRFCEMMPCFPVLKQGMPNVHQLIAISCLLLGSKAGELDEKIPFIPKLRSTAAMYDFSTEEVKDFEVVIGQKLEWNLQESSFYVFAEFFLTCGILCENDEVDDALLQVILINVDKGDKAAEEGVRFLAKKETARPKVDWATIQAYDSAFFKVIPSTDQPAKAKRLGDIASPLREQVVKVFELYVRDLCNLVTRGKPISARVQRLLEVLEVSRSCINHPIRAVGNS